MIVPVQVKGEVLDIRRAGAYHVLSLTRRDRRVARPGHFVTLGIGGEESSMVLRRAFAIHQVHPRGVYGGTFDVVVSVHGNGTRWLADRRHGTRSTSSARWAGPSPCPRSASTAC